jgi:hypothetical protein
LDLSSEFLTCSHGFRGDYEIVYLSEDDNKAVGEGLFIIHADLMCCCLEAEAFAHDSSDMIIPKAGAFGVSLKVFQDWDDIAFGDWWESEALGPPVSELLVYLHVEGLFWWRCFCEGIAYVDTEANKV